MALPEMNGAMDTEKMEIELLFEGLRRQYGFDFRDYSYNTARRRIRQRVAMDGLGSIGELQHRVLHDRRAADGLIASLSINVTEMFRDPPFFRALRRTVIPGFADRGHIKIWHAGCASGEEVYSMAILLREEGLYERATLYATDFNSAVLEKARDGVIPVDQMRQNIHNYQAGGGRHEFSDYYHARYEGAILNISLKKNIVFSLHNLTCDAPFGTFDMIVCRNVLIYFNRRLKERVFKLFADSLDPGGYLCLGSHESLMTSGSREAFDPVDPEMRIYQRAEA